MTTRLPYSGELGRKALHLLAMLMPLGMLIVERVPALIILGSLAVMAVSADLARARWSGFSTWIDRWFGWMMRPSERGKDRSQVLNGATWVMVTAFLLLAVFPAEFAAPGMVIAMIADAGAALVGRKLGRHTWPGGSRTVEGSLAFLVTGVIAAAFFPGIPWGHRLAAIGATAIAEIPSVPINDNLLLPFVGASVLWILAGTPPLW
ncbi:MAG: hypothetical protein JJ896_14855 [Rhodothermales bacterium]|nr:hypothetical protein [Rhodothermales bacterium]MBO6780931.1 hypothetical protein [Rhodothermales bacterium]